MGWKPSVAVRCRRSRRRELLLLEALRRASDGADLLLLRHAEGRAAAARGDDVGVVDLEAGALERVDVVDRRAVDVGEARPVDQQLQTVALEDHVAVALLVEGELILKARAAAAAHTDAQPGGCGRLALTGEKLLDLLGTLVREVDALGLVCDFLAHRFTKYSESLPCTRMPDASELKDRIEAAIPGAQADVESPDNVHFSARVVSDRFAGLSRVDQHKLVYEIFDGELGGDI